MAAIPVKDWRWQGHAGHFIGASDCNFRMATHVGDFLVSTVGEYRPKGSTAAQAIGWERLYETMVFRITGRLDCGCADFDPSELSCLGASDAAAATANHMAECHRVAAGGAMTEAPA